jgi:Tol biopolymer transport system component/DNA-binding winged helix-turn-helix (wHTH) protein
MLDLDGYRLERNGVPLSLEPKAFNLLALMVGRPGHVFTKQEIFESLWADTAVTDHALTRVVAQLRRVLGDEARQARYLETVPTRGYRWICPVEEGDRPVPVANPVFEAVSPMGLSHTQRIGLAAAVITVILAALVWGLRGESADAAKAGAVLAAAPNVAWPLQLTTHRGLDFQPAVSPTGDVVAFVSDRSGAFEIYLRGLSGAGTETPLTSDGSQNVHPAWSPDGSLIAFHSYRRGGIWVISSRGGAAKQIVESGSRPAWSPDGRSIAFQSDEHPDAAPTGYAAQVGSTLWLAGVDGAAPRALTRTGQPAGGHAAPAWSANGKLVAFSTFEGGANNGVWVVEVSSGATWPLYNRDGLYESAFARDGSALYVAAGESVILRLPLDPATGRPQGTPSVIPVSGVPGVRGLSLSADGGRLIFAGVSLDSQVWKQRVRQDGSAVGAASPLTNDTSRRNSTPAVSPDGSQVAYVSTRRGEHPNVWTMKIDGSAPLQLTADDSPDHQPSWSLDGRRVAYKSLRDRTLGVWTIDVETRREAQILSLAGERPMTGRLGEAQLSRSMTQIAFSILTPQTGKRTMYVTGTDRYAARVVSRDDVSVGYPAWSPDDRYLAVEVRDNGAVDESTPNGSVQAGLLDVASGQLRLLTQERGHTWVRSWAADGGRVAAAVLRDGLWSLRAIDVSTHRQTEMYSPESPRVYVRYPDWSRGGDVVVFERGEIRANIWSLPIAAPQ